MSSDAPAYGLWGLVILNSAIFIFFAFSFFKPQTCRDWRSLNPWLAETLRQLHPARTSRLTFSERFTPWMTGVKWLADVAEPARERSMMTVPSGSGRLS